MKKRTLSALLLAGVMAATMVPTAVFAATDTNPSKTTIGYVAGGNTSTDGRVMVTVPMDVEFKKVNEPVDGFDVKAWVWDTNSKTYVQASDSNKIGKTISVTVASGTGYKLEDGADASKSGSYTYTLDKLANGGEGSLVLDGSNTGKGQKGEKVAIGTLKDATTGGQPAANAARYSIEGAVQMTKAPTPGKNEKEKLFKDTLTYEFSGLN